MLYLHLCSVSRRDRLANDINRDSQSLPSHGITIRTRCAAVMGGLDPELLDYAEATRLVELLSTLRHPSPKELPTVAWRHGFSGE